MNSLASVLLAWSVLLRRASDRILARSDDLFLYDKIGTGGVVVADVLLLLMFVVVIVVS